MPRRYALGSADALDRRRSEPIVAVATAVGLATILVATVVLFSCVVPARRVLAVEASDALRVEG